MYTEAIASTTMKGGSQGSGSWCFYIWGILWWDPAVAFHSIAFRSSMFRTKWCATPSQHSMMPHNDDTRPADDDNNDESLRLARALQPKNDAWYLSDSEMLLPFECTSCGKCCRTKGSVYLSPTEIVRASELLCMPTEQFTQTYASHTLQEAEDDGAMRIKLRNNPENGACIFLDDDTNHCTIYEARPVQCSTYPFWPKILASEQSWNEEVRIPDDQPESSTTPYWTPDLGGCEGMTLFNAMDTTEPHVRGGVPPQEAHRQLLEYQRTERLFPRVPSKPV